MWYGKFGLPYCLLFLWLLSPCHAQSHSFARRGTHFLEARSELPPSLRLRPSVVLRRSLQAWRDYGEKRGGFHKSVFIYYYECLVVVNNRRIRQCPTATQQQWKRTRTELYQWLDNYWDWWVKVHGNGTWNFYPWNKGRVDCEQALSQILNDYQTKQKSRMNARKRLLRTLDAVQSEIARTKPFAQYSPKEVQEASAKLRREIVHLRHFALNKSPNTMRAIADCLRAIGDEREF